MAGSIVSFTFFQFVRRTIDLCAPPGNSFFARGVKPPVVSPSSYKRGSGESSLPAWGEGEQQPKATA
jgi:hypothetical protein